VTILEAASASLKANGAPVNFARKREQTAIPKTAPARSAVQVGPVAV